ncbi:hypothetical protein R69749_02439 [Paraburkholderia domus]|nr:hypothetical protein R69749_02439 [Paraburkholderia domus]
MQASGLGKYPLNGGVPWTQPGETGAGKARAAGQWPACAAVKLESAPFPYLARQFSARIK